MSTGTSFTDAATISALYSSPDRCEQRTTTLRQAKIRGSDATATIVKLAAELVPGGARLLEVGPGRGSVARALARHLAPRSLVCVDLSAPLLQVVRHRAPGASPVRSDFHRLPVAASSIDLAVAAFCLYHSSQPELVVAEMARCLVNDGRAIFVTKSSTSYHEIDQVIAPSGLDPEAAHHPSPYGTFCTDNATEIVATGLQIEQVLVEPHAFQFADFDALAAYLSTSSKYTLPRTLNHPSRLAAELRRRVDEHPVTVTSHVSYVVGVRR